MPQRVGYNMPALLGLFLTFLALFPLHHSLSFRAIWASTGRPTLAGSHASQAVTDPLSTGAQALKDLKDTSSVHNTPPLNLDTVSPGDTHPDHLHTTSTSGSSGSSTPVSSGPSSPSTSSHGSADTFSTAAADHERLATQPLGVHSSQETSAAHGLKDAGLIAHAVKKIDTYLGLLMSYWNRVSEYNPTPYYKFTKLRFTTKDAAQLKVFLERTGQKLNALDEEVLNEYYQALSAANKKSTATVHLNPETVQLLTEWEKNKDNFITQRVFRDFFDQLLDDQEVERRIKAYHLQRDQFRILSGWDAGITSMAKQTPGLSEEEVRTFGEALGGKKFVPPLDKTRATERLNTLKDLEQKAPQVAESWRNYMGAEYDSRVKLLETLAQMEHSLEGISLIEGWRAQNLDVERMLRIIDYRPNQAKRVVLPDGQEGLRFLNVDEMNYARKLYFSKTRDGIPWAKSLEYQELMDHSSPEIRQRYLDLATKLKRKNLVSDTPPPDLQAPTNPGPISSTSPISQRIRSFRLPFPRYPWARSGGVPVAQTA